MPLLSQPCCGEGLNEDVMWERKTFLVITTAATENDMVPRMHRTQAEYHFVMDLPKKLASHRDAGTNLAHTHRRGA